jgi:sugar phosphate isomerase/epimerase
MGKQLRFQLGVKTDPIQYRYSFEWLFDLLEEEKVHHVQLGTFFELYHLPKSYFTDLRSKAEKRGLCISSVFSTHRELGGFLRRDPRWEAVARANFERLIEVAAWLGAKRVGTSMGAVYRDQMETKPDGLVCCLGHMKQLLHYAHDKGMEWLTVEPMSCLAEPPTLPEEIRSIAEELNEYHRQTAATARFGYCFDLSHGYADLDGVVKYTPLELLEAALPWAPELHLKNTDGRYHATFGFSEKDRRRGVVDMPAVREFLVAHADALPEKELVGYLELPGPKFGRDYTDGKLEEDLRESLHYLKRAYEAPAEPPPAEPVPEM